jgi:hypothetical protein
MNKRTAAMAAALLLGTAARAAPPAPVEKAKVLELRAGVRDDKHRLKQVSLDQHKELQLLRDREKSEALLVKASGARPETIHERLLDVHERSRRERLSLRVRRREDRERLRRSLKTERAGIAALRQKK